MTILSVSETAMSNKLISSYDMVITMQSVGGIESKLVECYSNVQGETSVQSIISTRSGYCTLFGIQYEVKSVDITSNMIY